jgi:hypothetical protein
VGAVIATVYDVWAGELVQGAEGGSFKSDMFGGHNSRFYVVTPTTKESVAVHRLFGVAVAIEEVPVSVSTIGPIESVAMDCAARCANGDIESGQPIFKHCYLSLNSSGSTPSCAVCCLMGKQTITLHDCQESCDRAHGQCTFTSVATGGAILDLCSSCATGEPSDFKSRFASGPCVPPHPSG